MFSTNRIFKVYLDYCLFLQSLLKEANIEAAKTGERRVQPEHVRSIQRVS